MTGKISGVSFYMQSGGMLCYRSKWMFHGVSTKKSVHNIEFSLPSWRGQDALIQVTTFEYIIFGWEKVIRA